jgi:hypothetical protein
MTSAITDEMLEEVLALWGTVAYFAYDQYARVGRGVVFVERVASDTAPPVVLKYVTYDHEANKPNAKTAEIIESYDPDWELVVQYVKTQGEVRTLRIRTAAGARHPKRVWLLDTLGMLQNCPEKVTQPIPQPFWDFCEALEKKR